MISKQQKRSAQPPQDDDGHSDTGYQEVATVIGRLQREVLAIKDMIVKSTRDDVQAETKTVNSQVLAHLRETKAKTVP